MADIYGDQFDNKLSGTSEDDQVYGFGGNDTLYGFSGNDFLQANNGDDQIFGENGNDLIDGSTGYDYLEGGKGDDTLYGGEDDDTLGGGDGNDQIVGDWGNDTLEGGKGDDSLYGGEDDDSLYGGNGNDIINGDNGNDGMRGDAGDDSLFGGEGNEFMVGGSGDDSITGQDGNDIAYGSEDDDTLSGGDGNDSLYGENGNDLIVGQSGHDTLVGGVGNDNIRGNDGNDVLIGGANSDIFVFDTDLIFSSSDLGVDEIKDFSPGDGDILELSKDTFVELKTSEEGSLISEDFALVDNDTEAKSSDAKIVYDRNTGNLFYNENDDNAGFGSGGLFAKLSGNPNLSVDDFFITDTVEDTLNYQLRERIESLLSNDDINPEVRIFNQYPQRTATWTDNFDWSGVNWEHPKAGTAITSDIVVSATHFGNIPNPLKFVTDDGTVVSRSVIDNVDVGNDVLVSRLSQPLPSEVKIYSLPDPSIDYSELEGGLSIYTNRNRTAQAGLIASSSNKKANLDRDSNIPDVLWDELEGGDSGSPAFILGSNNDEVLFTTWTLANETGPYYGNLDIQSNISDAIEQLGSSTIFETNLLI